MKTQLRHAAVAFVVVLALGSSTPGDLQAQAPKGPLPVEVVNTPLPVSLQGTVAVRDVDNPARAPYQANMVIRFDHLDFAKVGQLTVPAGKVFVVELVTAFAHLPNDQRVRLTFFVLNGPTIAQHYFAPAYVGTDFTNDILALSQTTRLYAKTSGQSYAIAVNATRFAGTANQGTGDVHLSCSGYLLDE